MEKRKLWKCDFKDCDEIGQWYRECKGEIVKLCTRHETILAKQHWGRRVDFLDLDEDNIRYLQGKEYHSELMKKIPFKILLRRLEDKTTQVEVNDRQTGKWRSFVISDTDNIEGLYMISDDLEKGRFTKKPSLDEFVNILKKAISNRQ
jgi:hypothetical protein